MVENHLVSKKDEYYIIHDTHAQAIEDCYPLNDDIVKSFTDAINNDLLKLFPFHNWCAKKPEYLLHVCESILKINPNLAEAWNNKGVALADLKRYEEAIKAYDKAYNIAKYTNRQLYDIISATIRQFASIIFKRDCSNEDPEILLQELKEWFRIQ